MEVDQQVTGKGAYLASGRENPTAALHFVCRCFCLCDRICVTAVPPADSKPEYDNRRSDMYGAFLAFDKK